MVFSNHCQPRRNVLNVLIGCDGEDGRFPLREKRWCTKNDSAFCFVKYLISAVLLLLRKYAESTSEAKRLKLPANHLTFICQCLWLPGSPPKRRCPYHSRTPRKSREVRGTQSRGRGKRGHGGLHSPRYLLNNLRIRLMLFVSTSSFVVKKYKRLKRNV